MDIERWQRLVCQAPGDGRLWFDIPREPPGAATTGRVGGRSTALARSLRISPCDDASSRELLREVLRSDGVAATLRLLNQDDAVSRSYMTIGGLAMAMVECGAANAAVPLLQRCMVDSPERREAPECLGQLYLDLGLFQPAAKMFRLASLVDPANAAMLSQWALARYRGGDSDALPDLASIAASGDALLPWLNVGMAAVDGQRLGSAKAAMSKAIALSPESAQAWSKGAIPFIVAGEFAAARRQVARSLVVDPNWLEARVNLGRVLEGVGSFKEAAVEYEKALRLRPSLPEPRLNAATCYLGLGQFERGWAYYAARWSAQSVVNYGRDTVSRYLVTNKPHWFKAPPDCRVLVWTEQGVGDEIMFSSMLPDAQSECRGLLVKVDDRLVPLFARSFPGVRCFGRSEEVPEELYDAHLPMGDLGSRFRRAAASFEGRGGAFLTPDPARVLSCGSQLRVQRQLVVGISWRSANPNTGSARSLDLEHLARFLHRPRVRLVCLQYGKDAPDEVSAFTKHAGLAIDLLDGLDLTDDLDGVAAAAAACDVVVSIGNAVSHLAAACGVPTWLLAPVGGSWRWMFEGTRTPWYDSVRIYRQPTPGDWDTPLAQLSRDLDGLLGNQLG
jgi:tetratricopeptide (TPR) repeat protein